MLTLLCTGLLVWQLPQDPAALGAEFEAALLAGDVARVQACIERGIDVEVSTEDGVTPLHFAIERGSSELVDALLAAGSDADRALSDGRTPLMLAAGAGQLAIARSLVLAGADVDRSRADGATALMFAAFNGARDAAALLVEAGSNTWLANALGSTAAAIAAEQGHEEIAALISAGPAAAAADDVTRIARLRQAVRRGDTAAVQACLAAGADVGSPTNRGRTLFMLAIESRRRETAEALLAAKADLEARDRFGGTALITALQTDGSSDLSWLNWLLGAGADPGKAGSRSARGGVTPLMVAATDAMYPGSAVEVLVAAGAVVDARDDAGRTALMFAVVAAGSNSVVISSVPALLAAGADVRARDAQGCSVLWWACGTSNVGLVDVLLKAGAEVNVADEKGWTPLMQATGDGSGDVVKRLLEAGADRTARSAAGDTAASVARASGHEYLLAQLE
jgi:ankyrin repeat protein